MSNSSLVWLASVAVILVGSGIALGTDPGGGGAPAPPNSEQWDCSNTSCGAAGNGSCAANQTRCCCPTGNPPVFTATCRDADCNGQGSCQTCS